MEKVVDVKKLKEDIKALRSEIIVSRTARKPGSNCWESFRTTPNGFKSVSRLEFQRLMVVENHGDVVDIDYGTRDTLLSCSAGARAHGTILIWEASSGRAVFYVSLNDPFQVFSSIEKREGRICGAGGLNNTFRVYQLPNEVDDGDPDEENYHVQLPYAVLTGHDQVINGGCFQDPNKGVTVSADRAVKIWNIDQQVAQYHFEGHTGDIFCCTANPTCPNITLTGAGDFTARTWDDRVEDAPLVATYDTLSRDVNSLDYFPDGNAFAAGLSNTQVHLYDVRASCKVATFADPNIFQKAQGSCERVCFSPSGRLLFAYYKCQKIFIYDLAGKYTEIEGGDAKYCGPLGVSSVEQPKINGSEKFATIAVDKQGGSLAISMRDNDQNKNNSKVRVLWPSKK